MRTIKIGHSAGSAGQHPKLQPHMQGHFGVDFDFSKKGKYGVMCKFQMKDGETRSAKFWYTAK
jgi:hypothetical protein